MVNQKLFQRSQMEQVNPRVDEFNDMQHLEDVEREREVERGHYLFNTRVEPQTE